MGTEATDAQRYVTVGKVAGLYGVQGWVKVYSYTRPPGNILDYKPWYVRRASGLERRQVLDGRVHGKGLVARLEGVDDRDAARGLIGAEIAIQRRQLPATQTNEFYWTDLLGLAVVNREGRVLGQVDRIMETGANDVLVVRGDRERLIPLVPAYVVRVDPPHRCIEVDWGEDY